jgi:Ca2+-binding EF-hand superfamily protein
MRITKLITVVSSVMLGAAVAQAGDTKVTKDQFTAADTDRDGSITLTEAQSGMPTLVEKFSTLDSNSDGKLSMDELKAHKSMEADEATTPASDKQSTDKKY